MTPNPFVRLAFGMTLACLLLTAVLAVIAVDSPGAINGVIGAFIVSVALVVLTLWGSWHDRRP